MKAMALALGATTAGTADAATFTFSYTTVTGITAGDTIQATGYGTGLYSVDGVTGTRDNAKIAAFDDFDPTPQSFT